MAARLFLQPVSQGVHQRLPIAQGRKLFFFRIAQQQLHLFRQPLRGDLTVQRLKPILEAFEVGAERAIESIEMFFVLDQSYPGQVIKIFRGKSRDVLLETCQHRQVFGDRYRYARVAQTMEKINEHRADS